MYLAISTKTYNLEGHMLFKADPASDPETYESRITRHPTLDGGVEIVHRGPAAVGDRTVRVIIKMTAERWQQLKNIYDTELFICLALADGFYSAAIQKVKNNRGKVDITFYLESTI